MSDIALRWDVASADVAIAQNDLVRDDGLETAVILSLFTDRRAEDGDVLPDGHTDRRGWWGDDFAPVAGDRIGSRLWLLSREKQREAVRERAREYALEALQWMLADRLASRIEVLAEFTRPGMLGLQVVVERPQADPVEYRFNYTWQAQERRVGTFAELLAAEDKGEIVVPMTLNHALLTSATSGSGLPVDVLGNATRLTVFVIGVGTIAPGSRVQLKRSAGPQLGMDLAAGPWKPYGPAIDIVQGLEVADFEGPMFRGITAEISPPITGGGVAHVLVMGC